MDPSLLKSIDTLQPPPPPPPLTNTTSDQIPNHTAHVANPTPSLTQTLNHPPYAEMICTAIGALKERNGSSKRAIAKYIEKVYSDLPPTHSALLTHHLKRLKNNGHLVMVKKSYKLQIQIPTTRSDAPNNIALSLPPPPIPPSTSPSGPPKKGRGRPSKPKPIVSGPVLQVKRGPGRPPKNGPTVPVVAMPTMSIMAKKGRGRPPKTGPIGPKKSPGRPRKPKSLAAPNALKRGPGRPPKALAQAQPQPQPQPNAMILPFVTAAQNVLRPRGRPKKAAAIAAAGGGAVVPGKPRGRPPKVDGVIKPKKPKNTSGRPVGRPKKVTTV